MHASAVQRAGMPHRKGVGEMENTVTMPDLDPEVLELLRKNFSRRPEDKLTKPELEVRAQAMAASAGLSCCRSGRGSRWAVRMRSHMCHTATG
jgi:HD-GYP domain-containing protein (c-di-GMP phosphodiesterase class II)